MFSWAWCVCVFENLTFRGSLRGNTYEDSNRLRLVHYLNDMIFEDLLQTTQRSPSADDFFFFFLKHVFVFAFVFTYLDHLYNSN